ncbi:MAG: DUF2283 domain-containing protein [Moorea sp. SIO2B7]|nr:DUF2283 domain-containing protein [Moorena sp. SIO2B7]
MDKKLVFEYDSEGDILYINKCSPYPEQDSEEFDYGVIVRLHTETEEIKNIEVMFFSKRLSKKHWFELPITADLRLSMNS